MYNPTNLATAGNKLEISSKYDISLIIFKKNLKIESNFELP